jgi:hypothetical protein
MTTGNHTVRDIYCCKCGTILGWKYVSIHFSFSLPIASLLTTISSLLCGRTKRTNNPKSTKKGSTSWSVTSSSMFNSQVAPNMRPIFGVSATTLLTSLVSRFSDVRRNIAAPPSHKQHSSNLASAPLHPHVESEFSPTPTPPHLYHIPPMTVPRRQCPTGDSPTFPPLWCPSVSRDGTVLFRTTFGEGHVPSPPIPRESRGDWAGLMRHPRITAPPFFFAARRFPYQTIRVTSKLLLPRFYVVSCDVSLYNLTHCSTSFYLWVISQSSHLSARASHLHSVTHALL